jgi:serine/threonine protein kinase
MSGYSLNNKKNDSDERVDAAGNPLHVANLTFVPGAVLGRGSFGTVRLAKRSRRDAVKNQQQQHVRHESLPVLQLDATKVSSSCSKQQQPKAPTANTDNCGGDLDDSSPTVSFHDSPRPNYSSPNQQNNNTTIRELFDQAQQKQQVQLLLSPPTFKAMLPSFHRRSHSESAGLFGAMNESTTTTTDHERKELGTSDNNKALRADDPQQQLEDEQDQLVAVKIFRKSILKRIRTMEQCSKGSRRIKVKTALETVEREIALMKKLQHPNLVEFYEAVDSPESDLLYMVIEYMPLGEILTYQNDGTFRRKSDDPIDGIINGHFDEYHAALYFVDIMHGLAYLHQHHIIHRDLKPENVLLDARGIAKLSDFGVSHMFDDDDEDDQTENRQLNSQESDGSIDVCDSKLHQSSTRLTRRDTELALEMAPMNDSGIITKTEGTWAFWSPEMCEGGKAFSGYAADIWAAGVCLYVFVTGKLPFFTDVPIDLLDMIKEAKVPYDGLNLSDDLLDLLQMTLNPDPASRAGVGDCLKHPFLLRARAERVQSLSAELAKSEKRSTIVEEIDLQSVRILILF